MRFLLLIVCILIAFAGCTDKGSDPVGPPPAGVYQYTGYDSTGTAIVRGWLTLNLRDENIIDGEWRLEKIGEPGLIGPQLGTGTLAGGVSDGRMWFDLQPQFRDNNIDIIGTIDGSEFRGRWHWITFSGITNSGTFVAVRI